MQTTETIMSTPKELAVRPGIWSSAAAHSPEDTLVSVGPLMRMAKDGEIPKAAATLGISVTAQAEVVVRAQAPVTHGIGARPRIGINRKPI
jgi:hypothetical protein